MTIEEIRDKLKGMAHKQSEASPDAWIDFILRRTDEEIMVLSVLLNKPDPKRIVYWFSMS